MQETAPGLQCPGKKRQLQSHALSFLYMQRIQCQSFEIIVITSFQKQNLGEKLKMKKFSGKNQAGTFCTNGNEMNFFFELF